MSANEWEYTTNIGSWWYWEPNTTNPPKYTITTPQQPQFEPKIEHICTQSCHQHPYKCPVCGGKGLVPHDFYSSTEFNYYPSTAGVSAQKCRSCEGKGVLWR